MLRRRQIFALAILLQLAASAHDACASWIESPLLTTGYVEAHGLARSWYTQIPINGDRSKIKYIKLEADLVLVVTSEGTLHVIDANTGVINWTTTVGDRRFQTLCAGANAKYVAVVNGDSLYIYDRVTGKVALQHKIRGTAELGPVLTESRVLVPTVNGPLESYPLDARPEVEFLGPQQLPVAGRLASEPATFGKTVVWGGDRDRLFGQEFGEKPTKFDTYIRFGINSGPVSFPPMVYVGTKAGFLVAYDQSRGVRAWEFPTGSPIYHPPVALNDVVYALPQDGGMFAVKPDTGEQKWFAADPLKFAAASPTQVYTLDYRGRIVVIDAKTGARAGVIPLPQGLKPIINQETDRIVFYNDAGLIQCLHERQLAQPHRFEPPTGDAKPADGAENPFGAGGDPQATPPAATTPPAGTDPFGPKEGEAPAPGDATADPMAEAPMP
jgi:outer membrane protein assembly factor BamB